jgi:hypothetical protein
MHGADTLTEAYLQGLENGEEKATDARGCVSLQDACDNQYTDKAAHEAL